MTMKIEGEAAKRFKLYRADLDGNPVEIIAEFDAVAEVLAFRRRADWRYVVAVNRRFMTLQEFMRWADDTGSRS